MSHQVGDNVPKKAITLDPESILGTALILGGSVAILILKDPLCFSLIVVGAFFVGLGVRR
jgi:hypothetical protein